MRTSKDGFKEPDCIALEGSSLARRLLGILGWRVIFNGLPLRQGVWIAYPHTSNWDFFVLLLAKWQTGIQASFLVKDSAFRMPLVGAWLRYLGGVAVDRKSTNNVVEGIAGLLSQAKQVDAVLWVAITPEGTRKWTPGLRSGFYQTALLADVPLGLVVLDYKLRTIDFSHFYRLTGDKVVDMQHIAQALSGAEGLHPSQASPLVLLDKRVNRKDRVE